MTTVCHRQHLVALLPITTWVIQLFVCLDRSWQQLRPFLSWSQFLLYVNFIIYHLVHFLIMRSEISRKFLFWATTSWCCRYAFVSNEVFCLLDARASNLVEQVFFGARISVPPCACSKYGGDLVNEHQLITIFVFVSLYALSLPVNEDVCWWVSVFNMTWHHCLCLFARIWIESPEWCCLVFAEIWKK